jgi:hypothetical protein
MIAADEHPEAKVGSFLINIEMKLRTLTIKVIGVDLSPIQPSLSVPPPSCPRTLVT